MRRTHALNTLPNKELLTPSEVARYYSVSTSTVYHWVDCGKLLAVKIGGKLLRIPREAVKSIEIDIS